MPFANNNGVKIYYEVAGTRPHLLLHHGMHGSLSDWRRYVQPLRRHYSLVLVDSRGHGKSDKPHDPAAYSSRVRATDVVAVMDVLGASKFAYFGYSMGGLLGYRLALQHPERLSALIIGESCTTRDDSHTPADAEADLAAMKRGTRAWIEHRTQQLGALLPAWMFKRYSGNDYAAIAALFEAAAPPLEQDLPGLVSGLATPALLFAGEHDPSATCMQQTARMMRSAYFHSVPAYGHDVMTQTEVVVGIVESFLDRVLGARKGVAD